jgi:hypothetical protein
VTQIPGYITRRAHTAPLTAAPTASPASRGLRLHPDPTAATPPAVEPPRRRLDPVPTVSENATLTSTAPTIRLHAITSGVGSLRITADTAAWETTDLATGEIGDAMPVPRLGNRPVLERSGRHLIVSLRHIRTLRRLIVRGMDTTVVTRSGLTVLNPGAAVTAISVIDGQIEIRREPDTHDLVHTYRIGTLT